jgi:hypothetical protein
MRRLLLLGPILFLAACGSSNSSGSSGNAPTIANLRVAYSPPNPFTGQVVQVFFIMDVVDPNDDWVGGSCRFVTGNILDLPIQASGVSADGKAGTATCVLTETFQNSTVHVDMVVIDQAEHQSNVLSGMLNLEGQGRP